MKIVGLTPDAPEMEPVAELLVEGFRGTGSASWRTLEEAVEEIRESLQPPGLTSNEENRRRTK